MDQEIDQLNTLMERATAYLIDRSPDLIAAAVILFIGWLIARSVSKLLTRVCAKKELDVTLTRFFASFVKVLIISLFLVVAINKVGVEIAPFIALLGASAFGLSLAVQGPVSNYGAGIVLIITRPFKVDDTLSIHDRTGLVTSIKLGFTQLLTEDGEEITIPNRKILGEILTNSFHLLVVEAVVGIEYDADPEVAIAAVEDALKKIEGVSDARTPQVGIDAFGDSSIDIGYRFWVETKEYYSIKYAVNLEVFKALKAAGIGIPFPQRDVRIVSESKG